MQPEHQLGNEELYHIVTFYSCVLGNVSPYWIFFFFFKYMSLFSQQNFNTLLQPGQTTVCLHFGVYIVQGCSRKKSFIRKVGKAFQIANINMQDYQKARYHLRAST